MADIFLVPLNEGPYEPGDFVTFQLVTSADFPEFFAFNLSLTYDSDQVSLDAADVPNDLWETTFEEVPVEPDDASGVITIGDLAGGSFSGVGGGDTVLATLTFEILEAGVIDITFSDPSGTWFLSDATGSVEIVFDTPVTETFEANTPPEAIDDTINGFEDTPLEFDPLSNDNEADANQTLSIASFDQPLSGGTVTETDGGLTFTPDLNFNGQVTFDYTIVDTLGATDVATVTFNVAPVNDKPIAVDDTAEVAEGGQVSVDVLLNDSDVDGPKPTILSVENGANGTTSISDGKIIYQASGDFFGDDQFTYFVVDGDGEEATATVFVTVNPVNDQPVAVDDSATVAEDGEVTINVLANDGDPEGQLVTISGVSQGTNGGVAILNNEVVYTPDADFNGIDTFTYTITDGNETDEATVTVTVTPENDGPTAVDDTASVSEDGEVTIDVLLNDTDPDNQNANPADDDVLVIAEFDDPSNGTLELLDGKLVYKPNANFNGQETINYTISDGEATSTAQISITVNAVQEAPELTDDVANTNEDTPILINVLNNDSDPDGDTLTITETTDGALGTTSIVNGEVLYTPNLNAFGADSVTYTVSDGNGNTETATVSVTVGAVNDAPDAVDDSAETDEGAGVTIDVLGNDTDVENDALSILSFTQGGAGSVAEVNGELVYTPDADTTSGADSFTYTVTDGDKTDEATVTVTVNSTNDAPTPIDDTANVDEDGDVLIDVLDNDTDPDGDTLTLTAITSGPSNGFAEIRDGQIFYDPNPNYFGPDSLEYSVSDGNGGVETATVNISVASINDVPVITSGTTFEVIEGQTGVLFAPSATDEDGDDVTFDILGDDAAFFDIDDDGNLIIVTSPSTELVSEALDVVLSANDGTDTVLQALSISVLDDRDGDGIATRDDNAPGAPNTDQRDSDGDGFGNIIDADLDNDGKVGLEDLGLFRLAYGDQGEITDDDPGLVADFDGDGRVGLTDLGIFRQLYGMDMENADTFELA